MGQITLFEGFMPKIKLTQKTVDKQKAPTASGAPVIYWDVNLRGFGLLVSGKTATKTFIAQRDLAGGRTRRVSIASVHECSLADARERAAQVILVMRTGIDPKQARRERENLRSILEAYISARPALRPGSVADYRDKVERHLRGWVDWPLASITPELVEARHRKIASEVAAQGRYSGQATANATMRVLGVLWNFAATRNPALPPNPVTRRRRQWFRIERRTRMVPFEQLPAFYAAIMGLENKIASDYLRVLLFSGLRRREAASLEWSCVDFTAGVLRIAARSTKAGRALNLPLHDVLRDILIARRALGRDRWVFPANSRSGHIESQRASSPRLPPRPALASVHDLRRVFATAMRSSDISPMALRQLLNHSLGGDHDVTAGYIQLQPARLAEAAQRVSTSSRRCAASSRWPGATSRG
jgi:integrase